MTKIELHGYKKQSAGVETRIREALAHYAGPAKIVIETYPTTVINLAGEPSPYLHIVANPDELVELIRLLRPLGQDIEVPLLDQGISKRAMGGRHKAHAHL